MNLTERLAFECRGVLCYFCGQKVDFTGRSGWHAHIDPEFTDDGYLIEGHHRTFCSAACMDAWLKRETGEVPSVE